MADIALKQTMAANYAIYNTENFLKLFNLLIWIFTVLSEKERIIWRIVFSGKILLFGDLHEYNIILLYYCQNLTV